MLSPENRKLVERVFPQRWPASFRTFIENFPDAMNRLLDAARSEAKPSVDMPAAVATACEIVRADAADTMQHSTTSDLGARA